MEFCLPLAPHPCGTARLFRGKRPPFPPQAAARPFHDWPTSRSLTEREIEPFRQGGCRSPALGIHREPDAIGSVLGEKIGGLEHAGMFDRRDNELTRCRGRTPQGQVIRLRASTGKDQPVGASDP